MTTIYGITNCDTVRKARRWLDEHQVDYAFHDFRKDGLSKDLVNRWCQQVGFEALINKRGTTWRQLPDDVKAAMDESRAVDVMLNNPTVIKRPVLEHDGTLDIGFSADRYRQHFS